MNLYSSVRQIVVGLVLYSLVVQPKAYCHQHKITQGFRSLSDKVYMAGQNWGERVGKPSSLGNAALVVVYT
ncbi:MAG: hypothetical protein ACRD7E_00355, partial [Bryobacteraceae bacterium]